MLLEQAAPFIPKGSRVVVIPDGPLHQLNLETLVVPAQHPHFWVEDAEVVIAPSRALAPFSIGPVTGTRMLLVGAREDMKGIPSRLPNLHTVELEGAKATAHAYLTSQPDQFALIHFAAQAVPVRENPLESAVLLRPSREDLGPGLDAKEILKMPIHADLVTVAGCPVPGGSIHVGEGLTGLAWAFLDAVAKDVIGALWDCDAQATSDIVSELYTGIGSGADPVTSLRQAKLKVIKQYPKPYDWGSLQIYSSAK